MTWKLSFESLVTYRTDAKGSRKIRALTAPWREMVNQAPRVGDLRIEESLDRELRRYVRTARLFNADGAIYSNKMPELLDVRLTAMGAPRRSL